MSITPLMMKCATLGATCMPWGPNSRAIDWAMGASESTKSELGRREAGKARASAQARRARGSSEQDASPAAFLHVDRPMRKPQDSQVLRKLSTLMSLMGPFFVMLNTHALVSQATPISAYSASDAEMGVACETTIGPTPRGTSL